MKSEVNAKQSKFKKNIPLYVLLLPSIILLILFCNRFNKTAVINSSATFLVIFYTIEAAVNVEYAIQRVLDTLIGAVIAMIVNRLLPSPHLQEK